MKSKLYYWLAANGASCAMSSQPLPLTVKVQPRPEALIGIEDEKEAREAQTVLLTAPLPEVRSTIEKLKRNPSVIFRKVDFPQRPSSTTLWMIR